MPSALISKAKIANGWVSYACYQLFTPDRTRILHSSQDGTIQVWNLFLWELINIWTGDVSQVGDWAHLLNDQIIVSETSEESYNFWDITSGMPVKFCTASQGSKGLEFTHLASAPNDLTTQRWEMILRDANWWQCDPHVHNKTYNWVVYLSEGSILVDDKSSNTCIASLKVGSMSHYNLLLSPSGKFMLFWPTHSDDCHLWTLAKQTVYQLENTLEISFGREWEWSPDDHYIAIQSYDITLWDTCTGALVSIFYSNNAHAGVFLPPRSSPEFIRIQCFSPDG